MACDSLEDEKLVDISITHTLPENEWRRFVDEHPQSNVFHTPEMFQVFSRVKGHQPELWAATESERVLALLLPVRVTVFTGLLHFFTTRAVAYGSVLYAPGHRGREALNLLLRTYTREAGKMSLFTELRNLSNMEATQSLLRGNGFVYEDHLNYLIALRRPPEVILQGIGHRTRTHIRRGLRRGEVTVHNITEREQVTNCYKLLYQTYRRARTFLADQSLFEAAFDLLYSKGMVRFTMAHVAHAPVAVSVDLIYKDVIYGWYAGVDRSYSTYRPSELLLWHMLRWGAENGYRVFDFGGAGKPDKKYGVRDFKSKFGGELVCCGRNLYVHSQMLLRLSRLGYHLLRKWL